MVRAPKATNHPIPEGARLLDLHQAATYTGLSYWTLRDLCADGKLQIVRLPCGRQRAEGGTVIRRAGDNSVRKILIDRQDLDRLIELSKERF
jgi:predicted site-specific integrase-resolvase